MYSENITLLKYLRIVIRLTIQAVIFIRGELITGGKVLFALTAFEAIWMECKSNSSNNLTFYFLVTFLTLDISIFIAMFFLQINKVEQNYSYTHLAKDIL